MANDIEITVRVNNSTAAGLAAVNASLRQLRSQARDAGQSLTTLTSRAAAAAVALNTLENAAEGASRALRTLRGRATAAAVSLQELRASATSASGSLRTLDTRAAAADGRLNTLSGRTRTLRSDLDGLTGSLGRTGDGMNGLRGRLGTLTVGASGSSGAVSGLRAAALLLAPALVPIAMAAAPIAASMGAATVGVAAFAAAIIPQVTALSAAADAEKKYREAVAQHGKSSSQAAKAEAAYLSAVRKLPPATREAAAGLSVMKSNFKAWSDSLSGSTMPVFTKTFATLSSLFPKFSPLVRGASAELDRFVTIVAGGVNSPGFDAFMERLTAFTTRTLHSATTGVVNLSRALEGSGGGGQLAAFMDKARAVGPLVGETLANLARAILHLASAAGDSGVTILKVANALAKLVNSVPTGFLSTVIQLYAGMRLLGAGMAAFTAVASASATARIGTFFAAMYAGGVRAGISGVVQQMSRLQKAAIGLGVLGVVGIGISKLAEKARGAPPDVDRLTTSLTKLGDSGKFTGELRSTFGDMDGLVSKIKTLESEAAKMRKTPLGFHIPVLDDAGDWISSKVNDMVKGSNSLDALKDDFKGVDKALAGLASSGHADVAADGFDRIKKAALAQGVSLKDLNALFPGYRDAVASLKAEQEMVARGMGLFGDQALATKAKLDGQKQSADGLRQAIQALNDVNRAGLGGMIGFEAAIDAAAKAARDNAGALSMTDGQLDLNSEKARNAATALQDLAQKTDDAAGAARESGSSWEAVSGVYSRGREELIRSAQAMGLTREQAAALAGQILKIPDKKSTTIEMQREDALAGLDAVIGRLKQTKGKSVTVKALTQGAEQLLSRFGFKVERLKDGSVRVTAKTGSAESALARVQRLRNGLADKTINITTRYRTVGRPAGMAGGPGGVPAFAHGGIVGAAAAGGPRSNVTLVGEQGPEYVRLPYGSSVIPAGRTRSMRKSEREAAGAVRGEFGISRFGRMAGYSQTPFERGLGRPQDMGSLVSSLNSWRGNVQRTTHGGTERRLLRDLDVAGRALIKNAKLQEKVNAALDKAKDRLSDLKNAASQLKDSVAGGIASSTNFTRVGASAADGSGPLPVSDFMGSLTASRDKATSFAATLKTLKRRGLDKGLIQDIAQAGIEGGGLKTAESLMGASGSEITSMNRLRAQIMKASRSAGTTAADAMYGAGIKAAEGVVKGLEKNRDRIARAMDGIAKALEKAIKKAIGQKASGGIVGAAGGGPRSGLTLVGEQGPELARLPYGSTVYPAGQSRQMMRGASGGGGEPIVIQLNIAGRDFGQLWIDTGRREVRNLGGTVQAVLSGRPA